MTDLIGSDEVGLGSLIASLVVSAVRAPADWTLHGLRDSKKLTPKKREALRSQLLILAQQQVITYHISTRTHTYIDQVGVYQALKEAHVEAFKALYQTGDRLIADGNLHFDGLDVGLMQIESVIKADDSVPQVMAASIIAKCFRDEQMKELAKQYPQYGWESNFGYGSALHLEAIKKYGFTDLHRRSYNPVKTMIAEGEHNEK